ncbi:MAG TPA: Gfo/Idh/MocA family oxidoreductase, partial [Coriobacteriia bacterium]|nr:Gfo/Idh/MocA family oxidoreductase [Coriobacteriia bacterium]
MANLRAGLIGLGMMGRHHARMLGSLEGVDLVGVADAGGDPHGIAGGRPLVASIEELIALGLDYCVVALPTIYHEQAGLALADAGVGVVKDLATHDIDLTAWVAQQQFIAVGARTAFRSGREYEDLVAATGQLADGTVTNHVVNWLSPLKERVTIITGEKGAFVADTLTADLTFYANGSVRVTRDDIAQFRGVSEGDMVRFALAKPEPLRVEHEVFRDAVLGKGTDIVTLEQGMATLAVAE